MPQIYDLLISNKPQTCELQSKPSVRNASTKFRGNMEAASFMALTVTCISRSYWLNMHLQQQAVGTSHKT